MRRILTMAGLVVLALPGLAAGQATGPVIASTEESPTAADTPFGVSKPVDNELLSGVTGQADLAQVVQAQNNSTVSGNSVSGHSQTGTINFDASSFRDLNGLSLLSANTGNNVSINSSLNVNVAINQ
ncbi:MAG: hypothetical protein EOO77_14610 [Oxalobacteraceae bacterium]|nr:MAG: hypothetical protein EOO77_14610 [Oxalobacteraceae bacterium]